MTTFKEMHSLTSVQDFSAELVRELIGDYCVRGKALDVKETDSAKLFNRVDWLLNRVGRVLDVSGKLDATKTSFRIDRSTDNIISIRFIDTKGATLYTLTFGEKDAIKAGTFEYILCDASGTELVRDHKWGPISAFFAPEKEVALRQAAAPKKTKKEKVVKAVKNPVPATPTDSDVMAEVNAVIDDDVPPAELG